MGRKQKKEEEVASFELSPKSLERIREAILVVAIAVSLFLLLAMISYHSSDPSWSHYVHADYVSNITGRVGAWMSDVILYLLGYVAYSIPPMLIYSSWMLYHRPADDDAEKSDICWVHVGIRLLGYVMFLMALTGLFDLYLPKHSEHLPYDAGGILGNVVSHFMRVAFNHTGGVFVLVAALLAGMTLLTGVSWVACLERIGHVTVQMFARLKGFLADKISRVLAAVRERKSGVETKVLEESTAKSKPKKSKEKQKKQKPSKASKKSPSDNDDLSCDPLLDSPSPPIIHRSEVKLPKIKKEPPEAIEADVKRAMSNAPKFSKSRVMPKLSLLDSPSGKPAGGLSTSELEARSMEVEQRLADFGIKVSVVAVHPGPVVTRFELALAAGTKASKITNLAKDLARSLSVISVRVVEVIPGKSVIGIELPNQSRAMVTLQEVLASKQYEQARSPLTLGLGKDIAGHPVVADLAKMPHLLVAGTTGSGKSVALNAMLLSLLYKSTPEQLRLILIDPKMLELAVYEGIPHLLTPVVTDMKDAAAALRWCVVEMERRYRLMAALGVRNIAGYNEKVRKATASGKPIMDPLHLDPLTPPKPLEEMPYIVVLADEFADMMVVVGKKVETLIARLAQKARAAGVHLLFATQRPSVDVITGLIKANIPSRIAFQVSSKIDSRTILDQPGAEQLLGHGDMLYLPPGTGMPVRVHGAYVGDDEVHRVVAYLKSQGEPEYLDDIVNDTASEDPSGFMQAAGGEGDSEKDEFYDLAVEAVIQSRRVSISSIQRRFKIGYNRAARIVEAMEQAGVVSSMESNGSREVLVPKREDS